MIGFGPTVWSTRQGRDRVRRQGHPARRLHPDDRHVSRPAKDGSSRGRLTTGRFATLVERRPAASPRTRSAPARSDRAFYRLPVRKRVVVMLGGPTMNLLLAFVLFAIVLVGIGIPAADHARSSNVASCIADRRPAGAASRRRGRSARPEPPRHRRRWRDSSPATPIVAIDGEPVDRLVEPHGLRSGRTPVRRRSFTVDRAGAQVRPAGRRSRRPAARARRRRATRPSEVVSAGYVGLGPGVRMRQPAADAPCPAYMWDITVAVGAGARHPAPSALRARDPDPLGGEERSTRTAPSAWSGSAASPATSPPWTSRSVGARPPPSWPLAGAQPLLFLFNLMPLLPLDGGHVAGALWEGAQATAARAARPARPRPGRHRQAAAGGVRGRGAAARAWASLVDLRRHRQADRPRLIGAPAARGPAPRGDNGRVNVDLGMPVRPAARRRARAAQPASSSCVTSTHRSGSAATRRSACSRWHDPDLGRQRARCSRSPS